MNQVPVVALYQQPRRLATAYTRLCRKIFVDSWRKEELWEALLNFGQSTAERPVLFLTSDDHVLEASKHLHDLRRLFRVNLPEPNVVEMLMDKIAFASFAARHGLAIPKTFNVQTKQGWSQIYDECPFPCIVKPKYRTDAWKGARFPKNFLAHTPNQLGKLIEILGEVENEYLVQEWIPGPDSEVYFHLTYYCARAKPIASFTGRKIRQWKPLTGSTSMAEPVCSEEVDTQTHQLLKLAGFRGLGSVEFKRDRRDGGFKITEPTVGRPNLQSEVATANGINILYRAYCDLAEVDPIEASRPKRTVRWIFIERDIRSVVYYWRRKELSLRDIIQSYRHARYYAEFSWRDPMPFLMTLAGLTLKRFRGLKRLLATPSAN